MQLAEAEAGTALTDGEAGGRNWQQKLAPGASLQILAGTPIPCFSCSHPGNTLLMRNPAELLPLWKTLSLRASQL
jgi:hypothetical protein